MSVPSAAEQTLLDQPSHRCDLFLSIYQPATVFSCQVTGSYSASNQTITYYNQSGDYTDIAEFDFLVALVGTSAGADDKGRTYVRSSTATQLRFVESDHIDWANGDYITVLDYIEITPIFPRIIQDPGNELDVIFYKYYDVAYTDQNGAGLGGFPNMGCDYAGFLDPATGLCQVYYSASGSSNVRGAGVLCNWSFEGALVTGSSSHTPGYIAYDTPGHYKTILQLSPDDALVTDRATRYISIYDRPGHGSNTPILSWELTEPPAGSRDSGGCRVGIRVHEVLEKPTICDGALVVIFADEWFGSAKQNIGGNALGRQSIKFVGYVENGSIQTNYKDNHTNFTVLSPTGIMQLAECFSVSVESKTSPTKWYELQDMNVKKAIYHYLRWHSTVIKRHDLEFRGTDQYIQYFDSDRESLYSSIDTLMSGALLGKIVSDAQGKIWAEREPMIYDNADTSFPICLSIDANDWTDEPIIDEIQVGETAFIEMGGISYAPATDTFGAFLCSTPGVAPRYRGKVERIQGLALADQNDLNTIAGNKLAWDNARYPSSEYKLRTNFANLDIAPIELIRITMKSSENARGVAWTNKVFQIRSITWNYDAKKKMRTPVISVHEITQGFDAATVVIPDVPPVDDGTGGGGFGLPPIDVPPLPTSTTTIKIYHNGVYMGTVTGLNFIDDDCEGTVT